MKIQATHNILLCAGEFCFKESPYYSQENPGGPQLSEHTNCEYYVNLPNTVVTMCDIWEHEFVHSYNLILLDIRQK